MKKVRVEKVDGKAMEEAVRFMMREIALLRRLDHPNIVRLEGVATSRIPDSPSLYLIFEYLDHDLAGLVASPGVQFSEPQRRRDRINEKMHALQELIPNCNKANKASMLEEAIEYLKTLQMQIQIMSMSSGLCMPPMLLPPGMQPMHAPTMVRFSPMGVGMGMGVRFGYGMGMYDMHGSPPGCSMFPVPPPMHGPQLPCPSSIPGPLGLHGRRMFGIPGQGVPLPMPRPSSSSFGSCSGLSFRADLVPGITAPTACLIPASDKGIMRRAMPVS